MAKRLKKPRLRCAASVVRDCMGSLGRCARKAANGDLCHQHAEIEDMGKTVHRIRASRTAR